MKTEFINDNDEDFNIDQKTASSNNGMTGKQMYKELRANMDDFAIPTTKWKNLTIAEQEAWNNTAKYIAAWHHLIVFANKQ
jgi:hypothetical protein